MEAISGRIVDYDGSRVRLENPAQDMRMWFNGSSDLDVTDSRNWTTVQVFSIDFLGGVGG